MKNPWVSHSSNEPEYGPIVPLDGFTNLFDTYRVRIWKVQRDVRIVFTRILSVQDILSLEAKTMTYSGAPDVAE